MFIDINGKAKIFYIFSLKNECLSAIGIVIQIFFNNSCVCYRKAIRISDAICGEDDLKAAGARGCFPVKLERRTLNGFVELLVMRSQHIIYHEPKRIQDIGLSGSVGSVNRSRLQIPFVSIHNQMFRMLFILTSKQG